MLVTWVIFAKYDIFVKGSSCKTVTSTAMLMAVPFAKRFGKRFGRALLLLKKCPRRLLISRKIFHPGRLFKVGRLFGTLEYLVVGTWDRNVTFAVLLDYLFLKVQK